MQKRVAILLYKLMQEHLPAGMVMALVDDSVDFEDLKTVFEDNPILGNMAESLASKMALCDEVVLIRK